MCRVGFPCQTFREVKKAPASLYRGFKCVSLERSKGFAPRRSDFYPEAQIRKWPSKQCRSLSKKIEFGQTFVQKLLVEPGCRMSQRRDDFLLIALASGQPWRFAHHCRERRPRARPTSTSGPGCGCAARCWQ